MLRLPPFEYLAPRTVEEAIEMMTQDGWGAMLVAGGTDVYPGMKRRIFDSFMICSIVSILNHW